MSVTIPTKDVGDVQDKIAPQFECVETLEDQQADYIKLNMKLEDANGRW